MTKLTDYANKYDNIRFERRDGVLLLRLHTNDGPFVFSDGAHHNLSFAFYDLTADPENKVVILTGQETGFAPTWIMRASVRMSAIRTIGRCASAPMGGACWRRFWISRCR